jgi:hypothetical protein
MRPVDRPGSFFISRLALFPAFAFEKQKQSNFFLIQLNNQPVIYTIAVGFSGTCLSRSHDGAEFIVALGQWMRLTSTPKPCKTS